MEKNYKNSVIEEFKKKSDILIKSVGNQMDRLGKELVDSCKKSEVKNNKK